MASREELEKLTIPVLKQMLREKYAQERTPGLKLGGNKGEIIDRLLGVVVTPKGRGGRPKTPQIAMSPGQLNPAMTKEQLMNIYKDLKARGQLPQGFLISKVSGQKRTLYIALYEILHPGMAPPAEELGAIVSRVLSARPAPRPRVPGTPSKEEKSAVADEKRQLRMALRAMGVKYEGSKSPAQLVEDLRRAREMESSGALNPNWTVAKLKEWARDHQVSGYSKYTRKDDLIAYLRGSVVAPRASARASARSTARSSARSPRGPLPAGSFVEVPRASSPRASARASARASSPRASVHTSARGL